jgi:hypothetical protein
MPVVIRLENYYVGKRYHGTVRPGAVDVTASWYGEQSVYTISSLVQLTDQMWESWGLGGGEELCILAF